MAMLACGALGACEGERSDSRPASPPPDVVAVVDGHAITREALEQFSAAVATASGAASPDRSDARQLLLRLVDEELLLQRAVEDGLHRSDRAIRDALLAAVIARATAGRGEPDEATLRSYYEANTEMYAGPERVAPFREVREEVRRAVLRQQRERDLQDLLDALRRQAKVRILDRSLVAP